VYEKDGWNRRAQLLVQPQERTYVMGLGFRPGDNELVVVMSYVADYARPSVIKVWDLERGALKYPPLEHGGFYIFASALSPDGRTLATGDQDGQLRFWDVEQQQLLYEVKADLEPVRGVAFSSDSRTLASATEGGKVQLWHGR
jgi:WD40 repeat protein